MKISIYTRLYVIPNNEGNGCGLTDFSNVHLLILMLIILFHFFVFLHYFCIIKLSAL